MARTELTVPVTIAKSSKSDIIEFIVQRAGPELQAQLLSAANQKKQARNNGSPRKRKSSMPQPPRPAHQPQMQHNDFTSINGREFYQSNRFLDLPTDDEVKLCYRLFYQQTSNSAICMAICAICGREMMIREDTIVNVPLDNIPNSHRLVPLYSHPAHTLFDGKLLEPAGVTEEGDGSHYRINVCGQCWTSLAKSQPDLPPAFSLANGLWMGPVPEILSSLSFPEQLLIAQLYPRVYVFKLYPKNGYSGDPTTLQRGMGGTVSTFDLDLPGIISMVEGNLMPRPTGLLASLISITFIGLGRLPKHWLRHLFRVRRQKVADALLWLKENNKKYYGNICIDEKRISQLPDDDVPVELLSIVRQSTDIGLIAQESAGYVPSSGEIDDELELSQGSTCSASPCALAQIKILK